MWSQIPSMTTHIARLPTFEFCQHALQRCPRCCLKKIEACRKHRTMNAMKYRRLQWHRNYAQGPQDSAGQTLARTSIGCVPNMVMCLVSLGGLPCPENSPAFDVQFSKCAGDGHFLAFGTEWGRLAIVDTRVEAAVQRDANGPVGTRIRDTPSNLAETNIRTSLREGGAKSKISLGGRGVGQPAVVAEWKALPNCVFSLEWIHDDRIIALACGDNRCRLQHVETRREVCVLKGHRGSVKSVSANPVQQDVLLTGSRDGSFALWDIRRPHGETPDGQGFHSSLAVESVPLSLPGPEQPGKQLSPVEQVIKAHTRGGVCGKRPWSYSTACVPDPAPSEASDVDINGQSRPPASTRAWLGGNHSVTAVAWMADGEKFISAGQDGLIKLWDTRYTQIPLIELQAGRQPRPTRASRNKAAISKGANSSPGAKGSTSPPAGHSPALRRVPPFSPVSSSGEMGSIGGVRRRKRGRGAWDMARIRGGGVIGEEGSDCGRAYGVSSVHACDDGSRVAVCTVKSQVSVYRYILGTLRPMGTFTGNENVSSYYVKAKLSPDGSLLASGSPTDDVCVWDVAWSGNPIARLKGHVNEVTGIDWCRSEELKLASCADDETVRIWTADPLLRAQDSAVCRRLRPRAKGQSPTLTESDTRGIRSDEANLPSQEDAFPVFPVDKFGPGAARKGESARWTRQPQPRLRISAKPKLICRTFTPLESESDIGAIGDEDDERKKHEPTRCVRSGAKEGPRQDSAARWPSTSASSSQASSTASSSPASKRVPGTGDSQSNSTSTGENEDVIIPRLPRSPCSSPHPCPRERATSPVDATVDLYESHNRGGVRSFDMSTPCRQLRRPSADHSSTEESAMDIHGNVERVSSEEQQTVDTNHGASPRSWARASATHGSVPSSPRRLNSRDVTSTPTVNSPLFRTSLSTRLGSQSPAVLDLGAGRGVSSPRGRANDVGATQGKRKRVRRAGAGHAARNDGGSGAASPLQRNTLMAFWNRR